jgi:hypothetical protein
VLLVPWLVLQHQENILGHDVKWTRPGKLWTIEERKALNDKLVASWNELDGENKAKGSPV